MFHFCTISYTDSRYMYMYIATFDKLLKSFNLHWKNFIVGFRESTKWHPAVIPKTKPTVIW